MDDLNTLSLLLSVSGTSTAHDLQVSHDHKLILKSLNENLLAPWFHICFSVILRVFSSLKDSVVLWFYMQKLRHWRVKDYSMITWRSVQELTADPIPDQCCRQHFFPCGFSWRWWGWDSQPCKSWPPWLQQKWRVFGIFQIDSQTASLVHEKLVKANIRPQHWKRESIIKGKWKSWKQMLPFIKLMGTNSPIAQVSELESRSQKAAQLSGILTKHTFIKVV